MVLGFHAVGDAHTCTNPLYGRGCSLAMVQANLLADALAEHPNDADEVARVYEANSAREIEPWYRTAVAQDRMAREQARRESREERGFDEGALGEISDGDVAQTENGTLSIPPEMMRDFLREGLLPAVRLHAVVFRAFIRAFNLLEAPEALLADADVIAKVLTVFQDRENRDPEQPLGPPRAEMLAQLA
jgi:hypothetical protein